MKHSFKRLLSLAMALVMVLSCVPVQAFAEECAHEYEIVITGPSCTEPGSVVYTCGLCGDTYEEAGEEPAGHDYAVEETPATCLEDGVVSYVCTVCGETETEAGEAALGHCYVDGACELCGEPDPEAEEPAEEEPAEEPEEELVVEELDPVDSEGELVGGAEVSEAAAFDLATEIANADGAYTLTQDAEADFLILPDNFALTVASGVMLTINTQIIVQNGATLTFEEGAYYDDNNESDMPVFFMTMPAPYEATIFGVDTSDIWVQYVVTDMNTLAAALEAAGGCNYYKGNATFYPNVQIQGVTNAAVDAVTVPENVILELAKGASLTINNLTNNGTVRVKEGCSLWVPENGLTNNGVIEGEGTKPGEGGDIDLGETAVAQLGEDGETFATLEEAIAAAAAIDIDNRPFVSLLTDYTVNETIMIDEAINIFYIGGDGNNPTITAAEGVDTLFEIVENGELLFNDVDMVTPGDYIINITGNNATFMAVNCNLNGGGEAAINVADNVNWYYPPTDQWIPTTIQVYNSTVGGRTALHLGGSNTTATFAPGNESGAVELMGDNPDGVIVIDGDGHDVKLYGVSIETSAGNNNAFTMNGDSVIEIAGGSFNGDSVDDRFNGWGEPLPQSGAVARANAQYFGSLQSALDAAAEYEFEEGEVPLTILEELTIDNTVTLPETKTDIRMLGENITLTETGAINVYGKMSLELNGDNRIWMGLGTVHVFEGGDLWNGWQVVGTVTESTESYLSAYWVHEQGEGWFENLYEYHPNLDMRMAPGQDHCLSFYLNEWDADNGRWNRTSVGPDEMDPSDGLTAYAMTEQDWVEGNFKEDAANVENYVELYVDSDAPWDQEQTVTVDGIEFTVNVAREPNHGFYSAPEATNENWMIKYRYNKFRNENSFYFIFTAEDFTLDWIGLDEGNPATIEETDDPNVWKVTLNPDALELTEDGYRDFEIRVYMDALDGDNNEHNWDYSVWCESWIRNVQAGDDISHVDMMYEIDAFHNVDSWALGWIMDGNLTLDPHVNGGELDIDMGWRDDEQRYFRLSDECGKGTLTVRSGTKLIVNTPMEIYGGKIIIEDGGEMVINQPVVVSGGDIFEDMTYGFGSIEIQSGGKLTMADENELFINGGSVTVNGTMELGGDSMTTIQGNVTLGAEAVLSVNENAKIEVGSRGTLTVANSNNVNLAAGDSVRVFLPNDKVSGIDYADLWGTYLVLEASQMQTAVDAFAEGGEYVNYGIKEIAPYYSMTLEGSITIADDVRLVLFPWEGNPVVLTVPAGVTLTNNGEIYAGRDCHIVGDGDIDGNGTIIEEGITLPDLQSVINEAYYRGESQVWLHEDAVLAGDLWIPEDLEVFTENVTITVPENETLNLNGGLTLNGTTLNVLGTLNVNGPLFVNNGSYVYVDNGAALNVNHSIHVGYYKDGDVGGYAGVVDICGTMNACGYVNIVEDGENSGGVLNVYGDMHLVPDPETENRYGLLEIGGEFCLGGGSTLNMEAIPEDTVSILVGWNGSITREKKDDDTFGTIILPENPDGTVEVDAGALENISGFDKDYMIVNYNIGGNAEDLEYALTEAGENVEACYKVNVATWDTTIELDRAITVPAGVTLHLNNNGDGYYEELIIPEGFKLINDGTIVLNAETCLRNFGELKNNGTIILEQWSSMMNYGIITGTEGKDGITDNGGDYAEGNTSQSELEEALANMSEDAGGWIHESVTTLTESMTIDLGIRESDGAERAFWVAKYGQIIVPEGVTLTLNSPVSLNGGQIIVENGGELIVNNMLHIGSGTLYLEAGAAMEGSWNPLGPVTYENDEKNDHISAAMVASDYNEYDDVNYCYDTIDDWDWDVWYEQQMLPGYGRSMIFYFNHWNEEETIWERTPIHPDELSFSDGLDIVPLWEESDRFVPYGGQKNEDCFVMLKVHYDQSLWDTEQYVYYGDDHSFTVRVQRDQESGFYSSTEVSNETFLDQFGFVPGGDNEFYFIITDPNLTGLNFYAELQAGPEIVSGGIYHEKVENNVWKLTLDENVSHRMDQNFWLQVRVKVEDTWGNSWNISNGLNVAPWIWMRGMPDAMFDFNEVEYRYYAVADQWLVNRQMENGEWSEFDAELPAGVSYDLESNTLTLNGANLNYLGVGYHWSNGNEEGYNLPNPDLTIEVLGENEIGGGQSAFDIRGGANVTIVGDGSLSIWNNNDNGTMWSQNAVNVEDSILTIGGSVDITMAVSGENWWDFGNGLEPCTMHAIQGGETSNLIITDSAKVSVHVPDLRANEPEHGFHYRGLANFANVTVEKRATLNLDTLHLYKGQTFTQNGGTVNIDDPGTIIYMDDQGNTRHIYEPVNVSDGSSMDINGGTMNITMDDTDSNARGSGIKVTNGSTLEMNGGKLVFKVDIKAPGIYVSHDSSLFFNAGTMTYDGTSFTDGNTAVINVDGHATFAGGIIRVEDGQFNFYGWDDNGPAILWDGTILYAENTVINQEGSFRMNSGKMQLTNSRFHSNNNTVFAGGIMDMDNSVLIVNGYTGVEGKAQLDFDIDDGFYTETFFEGTTFQDNCAIEVNNYFPIAGTAKITIDAEFVDCIAPVEETDNYYFSGIHNGGTYHQMGGTVTINSNAKMPAIDSWGNIMLNAGTLNLKGVAGIQQSSNNAENEDEKNIFDMWEGFSLNVNAEGMGIVLCTNSSIQGGSLNVHVEGDGEAYGVYVTNGATLEISGGIHDIKAISHLEEPYSVGLVADLATVNITDAPLVNIEGTWAMYNRISEQDGDKTVTAANTELNWTENTEAVNKYGYILSDYNGDPITNIQINQAPATLQDVLNNLEYEEDEHGNHRYQLTQAVIVEESMELDRVLDVLNGGKITVRNDATLTLPDGSAHLIAKENGAVIVEAGSKIVNGGIMAADGGVIVVNGDGYEHVEGGSLNSHFHETPNEEGGYTLNLDSVRGIPEKYITLDGTVDTTEGLQNVLAAARNGYKEVRIWTANDMDLSDLYIPANTSLSIDGQEVRANVTVDEGTELYIDGQLNLGNVNFTVNGELHNYGYVQTDLHDAAVIDVNGIFVNHKEMNLNKATLNVNGVLENDGFIAVNEGSVINVFGELNDNGQLWVGFFKQTPEEAANNDCEYVEGPAGTVEVTGKLTVNEQMDIYGDGVVNVLPNGILENNNKLNIYGALTVSGNGTLDNQNAIELFGAMRVAGTLINEIEIWMHDTENQSGASLILDEGGTFYNHLSLYNGSYGGVVDVSKGNFINEKADENDPYDPEILAGYFGGGNAATMTGIPNGMIVLSYEGDNTAFADEMTAYGEEHGYAYSLFRVKGAAYVAPDQEVTVDWLVMLPGSQLGVNGVLNSKNHLRMRAGAEMTISSTGRVKVDGGMIVHPADENIGLEAAVVNNKGILECGAQGVLDILGEYNDSGKVYVNMAPTEYNEGYDVGGFTEDCVISEENAILVMDADNEWQVRDLLTWIMEGNYHGGLIRIDSDVNITYDLWIPDNVTVEINGGSLNMVAGTLINDGTVKVNGLHAGVTRVDGTFGGTGTYSGHCGENVTWNVKGSTLTISGRGDMNDYSEETPAPWKYFSNVVNKIVLDKNVTNIGDGAFADFSATMTIPTTVNEIGTMALGECTLKIYHGSYAETYVKDSANGIDESRILYFHVIDPETGICTGCEYSIYTVLDSAAMPEEKVEEIKNIDTETLKEAMEKSESDPEDDLVDQLDQLEQEVKNVTGLDVGIKHSEDVSEEIADAFSNVHEDAAIVGAVLNAEEGVEEVNLVIGDPEDTLDEEQTKDYNMDASVHFSMTMEGVGNASQLEVPVKITLPVPGNITENKDDLKADDLDLIHYHDGSKTGVNVNFSLYQDENGNWFVSFVVSGFSDFLLARKTTDVTLTAKINNKAELTVPVGIESDEIEVSITARDNNGKRISGLSPEYITIDENDVEIELDEALTKAGEYTVIPTWKANAQYRVTPVDAKLIVEEVEYACVIGEEKYESITDALDAAKPGDVVRLIADTQTDEVLIVSADTTLDLNGHYITAKNVLGFGTIIDNKGSAAPLDVDGDVPSNVEDGTETGGIINGRSNAEFVTLSEENGDYIPIYDTVTGSYKFFKELTAGTVNTADGIVVDSYDIKASESNAEQVKFRFDLLFDNMEAYYVLNRTTNSGLKVVLDIYWTGIVGFEIEYTMSDNTVKSNAGSQYKWKDWKSHMALTITGLKNIGSGNIVSAVPSVTTQTGVAARAVEDTTAQVYIIPEA